MLIDGWGFLCSRFSSLLTSCRAPSPLYHFHAKQRRQRSNSVLKYLHRHYARNISLHISLHTIFTFMCLLLFYHSIPYILPKLKYTHRHNTRFTYHQFHISLYTFITFIYLLIFYHSIPCILPPLQVWHSTLCTWFDFTRYISIIFTFTTVTKTLYFHSLDSF